MSAISADQEDASYLTKALFLAETMVAPAASILVTAKRERVFEQMSHSECEHRYVDFNGMQLWMVLIAVASWNDSLPARHRISETILDAAVDKIRAVFGRRVAATQALARFLVENAGQRDPLVTEGGLRDALAAARAVANRARRII